jgi:hypothetical protein
MQLSPVFEALIPVLARKGIVSKDEVSEEGRQPQQNINCAKFVIHKVPNISLLKHRRSNDARYN